MPSVRLFAGEVVRPLAGAGGRVAPVIGGSLDEVLRLAELQAAADGRVAAAHVQVEAAKTAMARARKVLEAEAGSVRSVDEAGSNFALAEAALATARAQRALLGASVDRPEGSPRLWVRVAVYSGEVGRLDANVDARVRSLSSTHSTLRAIVERRPSTLAELVAIQGMGEAKVERFGEAFLAVLREG